MLKHYIFDLDGTIIDSEKDIIDCISKAYREAGLTEPEGLNFIKVGPPLIEMIKNLSPHFNDDIIKNISSIFKKVYDNIDYPETTLYPGVLDILKYLTNNDCKLYIATSKRKEPTLRILDKLEVRGYFTDIINTDDKNIGNFTKKEMISILIERYKIDPKQAVMVGDSVSDIIAGKENGLRTIAVLFGYDKREELLKSNADLNISSIPELKKIENMAVKPKIAIFGATSHIAKSLIYFLDLTKKYNLHLYARDSQKVRKFIKTLPLKINYEQKNFDELNNDNYQTIINCIGIGTPNKSRNILKDIFRLTESYDNLILDYIEKNRETKYINFSSGAVFGKDFKNPVNELTKIQLDINHIDEKDFYSLAKINAEAKHRAYPELSIVDLRIYSYFSRFIELGAGYLVTDIIDCVMNHREFKTNNYDVIRDYVHPEDLFFMVDKLIESKNINIALDLYSMKTITKFEIIDFFIKNYSLIYSIDNIMKINNNSGIKDNYYSINKLAGKYGFNPKYTSLECISNETKLMIEQQI